MINVKKPKKRSADENGAEGKAKKPKSVQHKDKPEKGKNFAKKVFDKKVPQEKANWKEMKQQKKELKIQRKQKKAKGLYDVDVKAKKLYEELKMKSTKDSKDQLCQELYKLLESSDYSKLSQSHDRARIIQMMLKKAPQTIKTEIGERLIPHITEIALSKYGKFCVSRLMLYCGKDIRERAINGMLSNIVKLTSHKFSNPLVDMIFLNHASADQKNFMKQELYSDLYKNNKNKHVKSLRDTWEDSPMMKKGILNSTKMNLTKLASKNLIDNSLVHAVLLEFLEEAEEQERNEIITAFISHLAAIASTKQGSRAAVLCYLQSVAKERRAMLKSIKEHVEKLCMHEHGYLLILAILNTTDDTLNIKKTLLTQIMKNIETILGSEYGKRVIYFIMSPSKEFLHPAILQQLDDDFKIGTQKKDVEIRRKELVEGVEGDFCAAIKKNAQFWLQGGHMARVTAAVLQNTSEDSQSRIEAFDALCAVICESEWMVSEQEPTTIEEPKKEEAEDTGKIKKKKKNPIEIPKKEEPVKMVKGIEHPGLHIAIKKIAKLKNFGKSFVAAFNEEIVSKKT
jgi:pumilio homology domain family member 6